MISVPGTPRVRREEEIVTDANRHEYPGEVVRSLTDEIRGHGLGPLVCSGCGCETLYPAPFGRYNAQSRGEPSTRVCVLCGIREALEDAGVAERINQILPETMASRVRFFEERRRDGER